MRVSILKSQLINSVHLRQEFVRRNLLDDLTRWKVFLEHDRGFIGLVNGRVDGRISRKVLLWLDEWIFLSCVIFHFLFLLLFTGLAERERKLDLVFGFCRIVETLLDILRQALPEGGHRLLGVVEYVLFLFYHVLPLHQFRLLLLLPHFLLVRLHLLRNLRLLDLHLQLSVPVNMLHEEVFDGRD